jgi:ankyrin repeat protein
MDDEEVMGGICFGLSWLWLLCEDGNFGKYNSEWFLKNLTRFSNFENISVANWDDTDKADFHEFFELAFVLQSYNLLVNTDHPQSINYKQIFSAMNKLRFQHLKTNPYLLYNKNLHQLKNELLSLQKQTGKENIYTIISTELHAVALKISPEGFKFYDSNGFLLSNINDVVNYLNSKEFSSAFDNPTFKLFHSSYYTTSNQMNLHSSKTAINNNDKVNNELVESNYSPPKIKTSNNINIGSLSSRNRKIYLNALVLERQNQNVKDFLERYPSLTEKTILLSITHNNNLLLNSLLMSKKDIITRPAFQRKMLFKSIEEKNIVALKLLTKYNIDFNQYLVNQKTALHDAVLNNVPEMVAILLPKIKIEDRDENGNNLLHLSCGNEQVETLSLLLLSKKYNHYQINANGFTPIEIAIFNRNFLAFKLFYQHDPNISKRLYNGKSLLQLAIINNDNDIIDFLLNCKVSVNAKDSLCATAAHTAITMGNLPVLKKLVNHRCNINARDENGKTLLHYAVAQNNVEIVQYLVNKNVDLFAKDSNDKTAYQIARNNNMYKCANIIHQARDRYITAKKQQFFTALPNTASPRYCRGLLQNSRFSALNQPLMARI